MVPAVESSSAVGSQQLLTSASTARLACITPAQNDDDSSIHNEQQLQDGRR